MLGHHTTTAGPLHAAGWAAACLAMLLLAPAAGRADGTVTLQGFTSGDFRWRDVAGNAYAAAYRAGYSYTQAQITVTWRTNATVLSGRLTAAGLKPNFAYQFKLSGQPEQDPAGNERIGLSGRWWQEIWSGTAWSGGGNLNDKGDGSSPNPNDVVYQSRRTTPDASSPTGLHYRFTGYRPFGYFITDASGSGSMDFAVLDAYHVLWRTSQRAPMDGDGPAIERSVDPAQGEAYDTDGPAAIVGFFGEWERLPAGSILLAPGAYFADFLLTEESFHGVDGEYSGTWAHAAWATVSFVIAPPNPLWPTALDLGGGWKQSDWLGRFYDDRFPWVYHREHGWMYAVGPGPASIWFWAPDLGWLWTADSFYPFLYSNNRAAWLWYLEGSSNPRWFYDMTQRVWITP